MVEQLSSAQARRVALAAQGFGRFPPSVGTRQLNATIKRLGLLQLDSVNVFERSHYLPAFSRLGPYDRATLDRLTFGRRSDYTEAWAHQAAIIPVDSWPLWRWAMDARRAPASRWGQWAQAHQPMLNFLRAELASEGPLPARRIEHDANRRTGPWWGWSEVKTGLECLFMFGEVVSAGRTRFERNYALAEQQLPTEIVERVISQPDAVRELVRFATQALGIGTEHDIADYFRLSQRQARAALLDLVEAGDVVPLRVGGGRTAAARAEAWNQTAYLHRDARIPRRIETATVLSPFDPMVWERGRALRMFGFHYRIEIYTPREKRKFGYYSLPLMIDESIVGRIDLKANRQAKVLQVQSAWREPAAAIDLDRVVGVLRDAAAWQSLEAIEFQGLGDLSAPLASAMEASTLQN